MLWATIASAIPHNLALDCSRNLRENLEVHAELSYNINSPRYTIVSGNVRAVRADRFSYLLGLRISMSRTQPLSLKYYHNSGGLNYGDSRTISISCERRRKQYRRTTALGVSQRYFRSNTLMRDYLYVKVATPEPFEWLYFTPSLYSIYNLNDRSCLISASLSYKPVTNIEFIFWRPF